MKLPPTHTLKMVHLAHSRFVASLCKHHLTCGISSLPFIVSSTFSYFPLLLQCSIHLAHTSSSQSLLSLSPSVTPSVRHSRLETHLFRKSSSLSGSFWTAIADFGSGLDLLVTGNY